MDASGPSQRQGEREKKRGDTADPIASPVRSVYLPVMRSKLPGMFTVFDFAEPDQVNGQRDVTTVPPAGPLPPQQPLRRRGVEKGRPIASSPRICLTRPRASVTPTLHPLPLPSDAEVTRSLAFLSRAATTAKPPGPP